MHSMAVSLPQRPEAESRNNGAKRREPIEIYESTNFFPLRFAGKNGSKLEYRFPQDDAWYDVTVFVIGGMLVIKYDGFPSDNDELYEAPFHFSSSDEIKRFGASFRPSSVQMQDSQCGRVREGTVVCASYHFDSGDVKFYDATVVRVQKEEHGQGACRCTYWLSWRHGPLVRKVTPANIEDICLRPEKQQLDSTLVWFLKKANEKLQEHQRNVPESSGTRARASTKRLSYPTTAPKQRTVTPRSVGESSASNKRGLPPLSPDMERDSIARTRGQRSKIRRTSQRNQCLCEKTVAPIPLQQGEQVTQTNESHVAPPQRPPNNELNDCSWLTASQRKFAIPTKGGGKLSGECKKR